MTGDSQSLWVSLLLSLAITGCGSDDSNSSERKDAGGGSGGSGGSGGGSAGGSGGASTGCGSTGLTPGNSSVNIQVGATERNYLLHVPPSYDGKTPLPLVLNFHGFGSNATQQEFFSAMDAKADSAGFIVAYPNGLVNPSTTTQSWNAGACCAFGDTTRDDVAFVSSIIDDISAKSCLDRKRVYATGMSNGGFMSHYLGCKLADRIAAIAPVAGVLGIPQAECTPSRPMPIVHFHGTGDAIVPYDGGGALGTFTSVPQSFAAWASIDGCTGSPKQTFTHGTAHCDSYDSCKNGVEVTLCTIDGEGHCWPGQSFCPFGTASTDISADDRMWELFQKFSL